MPLRARILTETRRITHGTAPYRSVCRDENGFRPDAKRIPLIRLVPHGNLVKRCAFIRNRDTIEVKHFPQDFDDDLLVAAGDSLLDFSLGRFIDYFRAKGGSTCVMRYYEPELSKLRTRGVLEIDETDRVLAMTEKPSEPRSHWCAPPFYLYSRADLPQIGAAIASGCAVDAPGSLIEWLCGRAPVYAFEAPGKRYDIGDAQSYELARQEYRGIVLD